MTRTLPDYEAPPVTETVLGVEFAPLANFGIPHFGLFWQALRADYPQFSVQPRLDSQIEIVGARPQKKPGFQIQILSQPPVRCWFINANSTELVQVQADRFICNWRKIAGTEVYPHYDGHTRPRFCREWERFCTFLRENQLGQPDVRQCEITYFNHLDKGQGWNTMADLASVFPYWSGRTTGGFLPVPEVVDIGAQYLLPDGRGRLHITVQPAIRHADQKEILQITLTARGRPVSGSMQDMLAWFDVGREWIVKGFTDFTTEAMHRLWKRTV
jgi:uncharacterized protein (TIGR04255 family)